MPNKYKSSSLQKAKSPDFRPSHFGEETEEAAHQNIAVASEAVSGMELRRVVCNPGTLSPGSLMSIQRTYGNQAAMRMIQRSKEQAALTVQRVQGDLNPDDARKEKEFQAFLTEKSRIPYFQGYCKKEFSEENFLAYHAIRHYKKNPSYDQAEAIYNQYIAPGAPRESNLAGKIQKEVEDKLNPLDFDGVAATIFDAVLEPMSDNMKDTFSRFLFSEEYQQWKNASLLQRGKDYFKGLKSKREGHMDKVTSYKKGGAINI